MWTLKLKNWFLCRILLTGCLLSTIPVYYSCSGSDEPIDGTDTTVIVNPPVNHGDSLNPHISDDYANIADISMCGLWGSYNLHDPSIIKYDGYYYIFSTDVAYGDNLKCGIMIRKSKDLVHWTFLGWVFNGSIPSKELQFMTANQAGFKPISLWAPFILKVGDTFRLYYSVPGNDIKLACIGLATSKSPLGPWTDEGIVISCLPSDPFNAIDPSVIIDRENGKHWMTYGSYEEGIFIVELDPETGKRLNANDLGNKIAYRLKRHDAIEGSEILYNDELKKYYLFVSYDWLEDSYNVRVGRADHPEGPYLDINGNDMADIGDNMPRITAQYKFLNHAGWQGFGHCGLFKDSSSYFYVSQARLGSNKYFMDLHIRKMIWTPSGWPVISPERYAGIPQKACTVTDIPGKWEFIELQYTTMKNESKEIELTEGGGITGIDNASWSFTGDVLTITYGTSVYEARLMQDWDWENSVRALTFTGMSGSGVSCWGKKRG